MLKTGSWWNEDNVVGGKTCIQTVIVPQLVDIKGT